MRLSSRLCALLISLVFAGCGGGSSSGTPGGDTPPPAQTAPVAPTGLSATPGDGQVALTWTASTGATGYYVKRGDAVGGPYTQVGAPTGTTFTNTGLTNGTAYYYVVTALNTIGESGNSSEVSATPAATSTTTQHPYLFPASRIDELAAGGADWTAIKGRCDAYLNEVIDQQYDGNYAGWGYRDAAEDYAWGYLVSKKNGDTASATKYGKKGLAMAKVLSRHCCYYGSVPYLSTYQFIGQGDGHTTSFALPMTLMASTDVAVMRVPTTEVPVTHVGSDTVLVGGSSYFGNILKVSNTSGGPANYGAADYLMAYRDPNDPYAAWVLYWGTSNHPAQGATYYVTVPSLTNPGKATAFTQSGNNIVFSSAPATSEAVFVQFISDQYEQTGNFLGGLNAVQPDGPGYPSRAYTTGLAEAYDAFHDVPEFTDDLKTEFYTVQNARLDWYKQYGYERDGDIGNYFVEGFLQPVLMTGYGTQPENPRAAEWRTYLTTIAQNTIGALENKIPSGYGIQGGYSSGTFVDVMHTFSLLKSAGGPDLLTGLAWTDNVIPAIIQGTKPDRTTFYDGGDWYTWEDAASYYASTAVEFIQDFPSHPMVPYARQWLQDIGKTPPAGPLSDYKTSFTPSCNGLISGPVYARSDWGTSAVWVSLVASFFMADHQHHDQGHFTIQRGADYLIRDGGGYGIGDTLPWHNTIGFDDRGAGGISTYPPGQGNWGDNVRIDKFQDNSDWVYVQTNYADAYRKAGGTVNDNSVKKAVRSLLYLRSLGLIVLHDQVAVAQTGVKQIFNMNFAAAPTESGGVYSLNVGTSKLFARQLVAPTSAVTALVPQTEPDNGTTSMNYTITASGQTDDTFLHVFQAGPSSMASMAALNTVTTSGGAAQGIEVMDGTTPRVCLFATQDNPFISGMVAYTAAATGSHQDVISDLRPTASYAITVTQGATSILSTTLTSTDQGTLVVAYTNTAAANVTVTPN
jgi:hypothetical protein